MEEKEYLIEGMYVKESSVIRKLIDEIRELKRKVKNLEEK